jgi:gamma-aminobutyric acid type B receptor
LEAPLAYDAIWAVALALNRTLPVLNHKGIRIESFNYRNGTVIRDAIKNALKDTQFLGVSGLVAFSERGTNL